MFMDVQPEGIIKINNKNAADADRIYDNFVVTWSNDIRYEDLEGESGSEQSEQKPEKKQEQPEKKQEPEASPPVSQEQKPARDMRVIVNHQPVTLKGKSVYKFVDVFDFYEFDLSTVRGSRLVTNVNGHHAEYVEVLQDEAVIDIYWEK